MFATQVLPETLSDDSTKENNSEIVGIIIVNDKKYELKKGETKIGRDASLCSIVIENFTISKVHAVIESDGVDDTFIYDVGSTNQTKLGKKILKPHCRYKLDNESNITLGNITAKFIIPPDRDSGCSPEQGNFDDLNELGDIFDVPTQVTVAQPTTSSKTPVPEKSKESFQVFKIPHSVSPIEPSTSSKIFDEDTQCRLNSQQTKPRTAYYGSIENSGIFSLGTQCQLYEPPAKQGSNCAVQTVDIGEKDKDSESDKIKSLLNDGQDDVLLCFMSMHSPNEPSSSGLVKETKIKTECLTQAQVETNPESVEEKERRELSEIFQNKELIVDFSTSNKPNITSTPLNNKFIRPSTVFEKKDTCTQHLADEDFIQTQEFVVNHPDTTKQTNQDALSQDSETQPYLEETLDELVTSENKNDDEDLILTQTFRVSETSSDKISVVVPESEEFIADKEDFMETQIFPAEPRSETRNLPESPERDVDTTVNFTQRNNEDDFIATQLFEERTDFGKDERSSDRNNSDDDEDFIATQKVEFPISKTSNRTNSEAVATASRESSPDLLVLETFSKNSEDCISTQKFEMRDCQNLVKTASEISSREKEKDDCNIKLPEPVESSGDETESDLEIILEETKEKDGEPSEKFIKCEQPESNSRTPENDESNSSYVFELEPGNQNQQNQDSDATDCEEIIIMSPKVQLKQEPKEKVEFEGTQVLTLTVPDNFEEKTSHSNDDWMTGGESPRFGCESPLSLEMPNTQDIETTIKRIMRNEGERDKSPKKTEVGIADSNGNATHSGIEPSKNQVDSPLKRPWDSSSGEVVPVKKCKNETSDRLPRNNEKLFSKLVQAHDIAQIKPNRTRNSLRNLTAENKKEVRPLGNSINNERPTSRRKTNGKRGNTKNPNGDITPYLTKKMERRSSHGERKPPNENQLAEGSTRVLRSSMRNTALSKSPDWNITTRQSRRNSRTKNDEYFGSSCVNVIFTGFDCESLEKIISDLGGKKTNDLFVGEVVVADKVRRTVKFLSAIGLSLPIASPQWLLSCKKEKRFLNPWDFILKDEEAEEKWDFELKASLEKSKKAKLLQGFSIFATKSTKPPVKDLLAIVEFCGGTPLFDFPDVWPKKTIIVSCLEDKKWWPLPKFRNIKIVHYEFILSGVLRQKIDFKTYKLR